MTKRNGCYPPLELIILILTCVLFLGGCAPVANNNTPVQQVAPDSEDLSCSYFYFLWGTHAEYEGRFEEAADAYRKALVCDPSAHYIMHKLPLLHLKNGDMPKAIAILSDNVTHEPEDTASRMLLARLYVQQKKFNQAITQYEAILDYEPEHEQALLRLGILLHQIGKTKQARRNLTKLITLYPESYLGNLALARMADSYADAVIFYERALELNQSVELYNEIAQLYIDREKYDQAVKLLTNALENDKENEQIRLLLTLSLLGLGQEEAAVVELSLIPQYRNNPAQLTMVISKLYVRLNNHQMAIAHLRELLATADESTARYLLGVIYSDLQQFENALTTLEPIGPDADEFEDAVFLRAKMLHQDDRINQALSMLNHYMSSEETVRPMFFIVAASLYKDSDQYDRALEIIKEGFSRYPDNERILFEYGLQLEQDGQIADAISIMERLLLIKPDHAEALNFVGYTWADTNQNLDKALDYIVRAVELRPGNGYIQDSLGWIHFRMGNLEQARDELLYAAELVPEDPHIHDHLGDVYRALHENKKAVKSYSQALRFFEEDDKKNQVQAKIDALR